MAEEGHHFAGTHVQVDVVEGNLLTVLDAEAAAHDGRGCRRRALLLW
jgi:hypothetical protein